MIFISSTGHIVGRGMHSALIS